MSGAGNVGAVIFGASGQVVTALLQTTPDGVSATALASSDVDIRSSAAVLKALQRLRPNVVINPAAYTAVDRAESDSDDAFAVNRDGAENVALACSELDIHLVHVSTDFVFDGTANTPLSPSASRNPLGVYGTSKSEGEDAIRAVLGERAAIVRTSWVYGATGANFCRTMLRLMAERDSLGVVMDQVGCPTHTAGLANALWAMALGRFGGTHHWTDAGVASWYDFAVAIADDGHQAGLLPKRTTVKPIRAVEYPTPAKRPSYSVLDTRSIQETLGMHPMHWRDGLRSVLAELAELDRN